MSLFSFRQFLFDFIIFFFRRKKFESCANVAQKWPGQQWHILSAVNQERIHESGVWNSWPSGSANNLDTQWRD